MSATLVSPDIESLLENSACCSLTYVFAKVPFCVKDAEWAVRLACCGQVKVVCNDHLDIVNSILPKIFVCTRCHARRPAQSSAWRI